MGLLHLFFAGQFLINRLIPKWLFNRADVIQREPHMILGRQWIIPDPPSRENFDRFRQVADCRSGLPIVIIHFTALELPRRVCQIRTCRKGGWLIWAPITSLNSSPQRA